MRKSLFCFHCVLISCFLAAATDKEGQNVRKSAQCPDINKVQVQMLNDDILRDPEKRIDLHDGIEIYIECGSSTSAKCDLGQRMTSVILDWITWPFKSLKNITVSSYEYLVHKTAKRIALELRRLKDKFQGSIYSYLKPKLDNPLTVIEGVPELIWTAVRPLLRTLQLLCDFIAVVFKQAKVKTAEFLKKYPAVVNCFKNVQVIGGHVFSVVEQWPLGWQDSIEFIGFSWVITYFMFNLIKFSAMDESKLHRTTRRQDNIRYPPKKKDSKKELIL
ncbi:unnamed protein product [Porites evermanni]|uniref:Uncharacterized protein n=1 Tax=Porites evermanni TaxID=104178 RepID=A0ABN8QCG1_9CNID|nr:unnamed protein product [Porites evermanni]